MTKQQVKVVITTQAGFSATADDAVSAGQGTAAYGALENHRDVVIAAETEKTFVPYHAVDHAVITFTRSTVDDPEDPTCVTDDGAADDESGAGSGNDPVNP